MVYTSPSSVLLPHPVLSIVRLSIDVAPYHILHHLSTHNYSCRLPPPRNTSSPYTHHTLYQTFSSPLTPPLKTPLKTKHLLNTIYEHLLLY